MARSKQTAIRAKAFTKGNALYQKRGWKALPILVRQAKAGTTITYGTLAAEIGMPNARNLNYVLGSVGQALVEMSQEIQKSIPPITCLVVNEHTKMPGEGVSWFISTEQFRSMPKRHQRELIEQKLAEISAYSNWDEVLQWFGLEPAPTGFESLVNAARTRRGGGEGPEHAALKAFIAINPKTVGLPASTPVANTEYWVPSGDSVDVLFESKDKWTGIEVKPHTSDDTDLTRGMFQCVKYQTLLEADLAAAGKQKNVEVFLVTERELPLELQRLRTTLGVNVIVCMERVTNRHSSPRA